MTAQGTPQSQIESLQQALAAATERAERAEAASRTANAKLQNYAIELGEALGQNQRLLEDNATLARELESAKVLDAQARTDWERLTRKLQDVRASRDSLDKSRDYLKSELEAERAGSAKYREALTKCRTQAWAAQLGNPIDLVTIGNIADHALESSTAGAEMLLRKPNDPLPNGCYCKPGRCMAPVVMGQQMPCRDPQKAALPREHLGGRLQDADIDEDCR